MQQKLNSWRLSETGGLIYTYGTHTNFIQFVLISLFQCEVSSAAKRDFLLGAVMVACQELPPSLRLQDKRL